MKLLIVEDSELVADRLHEALRGIQALVVATAGGVAAASESLRTWQPQLVVLDIGLPDGSGLDLLRSIKRERPATRVLMFSNHTCYRRHCEKEGADAFFDKMTEFEALAGAVRNFAEAAR